MDLYIYYRVRRDNAAALQARVAGMQQRIAAGMDASLKRRPEEKDGLQTWMEVYLAVPDGFEAVLQDAAAEDGLAGLIEGPRHIEHFVDIPACA